MFRASVASLATLLAVHLISQGHCRPPVQQTQQTQHGGDDKPHENETAKDLDLGVDYNRYLQEVVQVLESDPEFRKKLETSDVEKIRDGSIAHELEMVNHNLRTQLDNVKRKEMDRLRQLAMKQFELNNGIDHKNLKVPNHLDMSKIKFEVEDLKKLIKATTDDLEEADKQRREEFKRYEMEKRFEKDERLKHIENEDERKKEEERLKAAEAEHKKHKKLAEPGHKEQLEEVWEKDDHMDKNDFDPKTFFRMHDLNGDGQWTDDELKALFQKQLDEVYDPNNKNDDMVERAEEAERMREHVIKEMDKNKDRMISEDEFLKQSETKDFETDDGWDTFDEDNYDEYSEDEFKKFEHERQAEIQGMIDRGQVPPGYPYFGEVPPGAQPYHLPPPQVHPGGVPRSIPGQPAYNPQQPPPMQPGQPAGLPVHPGQFQQQQVPLQQQGVPMQQPGQFQQGAPIQQQQPGQFQQVPQGVPQMQQQQQPSGGQFQQQQLPQQPAVGVNPVPVNRGGGPPPQAQPVPIQQQQQPRQGGVKP